MLFLLCKRLKHRLIIIIIIIYQYISLYFPLYSLLLSPKFIYSSLFSFFFCFSFFVCTCFSSFDCLILSLHLYVHSSTSFLFTRVRIFKSLPHVLFFRDELWTPKLVFPHSLALSLSPAQNIPCSVRLVCKYLFPGLWRVWEISQKM